jgi:dihydroorotate dehydrogenase
MIEKLLIPILHQMDPEKAHDLTIKALHSGVVTKQTPKPDKRLTQTLWNLKFPNPVGLAAGFDKNAETMDAMFGYGFGFVEIGTVTPLPQDGNPQPRVFRDKKSKHVINRMGFPNQGADMFEGNYQDFRASGENFQGIVGINVGKNKDQTDALKDYVDLVHRFGKQADYLAVNVSSPNTPGLRDLQDPKELLPFLQQLVIVRNARCKTPLLVKLAPDLSDDKAKEIAKCVQEAKIDGIILTNTTLERPSVIDQTFAKETGGLSGPVLQHKSNHLISLFYKETGGTIPIIGVGGVDSAQAAYDKIKSGASLIQLYTTLIYQGPGIAKKINDGLIKLLNADGYNSIAEAIGKNVT